MANVITYGVTLDATGAINGFRKMDAAIDQSGKSITALESRAKALGVALGLSVAGGLAITGAALRKMVHESSEAQRVQSQLAAGLRSTANASGQTVRSLNAHAEALSRVSTFSDEAVGSAQSILLTFTKIAGETFPRATSAIVDMATRMGGDLTGAAVQLGKALNDPVQGITALTRVGVSFTESQKQTIKSLAETNRLAEAQAMILRELEAEFGGSAAAAADTLGGALTRLENAWGNVFEVSRESSGGMIGFINDLSDNLPRFRSTIDQMIDDTARFLDRANRIAVALRLMKPTGAGTGPDRDGAPVVTFTSAADRALFGPGTARAITITAEVDAEVKARAERRAAFDEAKRNAAERQRWETEAIETAVRLAQARFAAEHGTPLAPGAGTTVLGRSAREFGNIGRGVRELPTGMRRTDILTDAQELAKEQARIAIESEERTAEARKMIAENFLRGVQGSFSSFFQNIAANGIDSFRGLMDSFRSLVVQTFAELAARKLTDSLFGNLSKAGGASGLLGGPVGIGLGAIALVGSLFGRRRSRNAPEEQYRRPSPWEAAEMDRIRAEERASDGFATARDGAVRQSVGGILSQSAASRIVGNLESIRVGIFQLVALAERGAMGGPSVSVNASASDPGGMAASVAATVDRLLGTKVQSLRLAAGVAVVP